MIPEPLIEALRTVPAGGGKSYADLLLERREKEAADFAARFPKGPPLSVWQRYFNKAIEDMKAARRTMERSPAGSWEIGFAAKSFAAARESALHQAALCEKSLGRSLTDAEWTEGFVDPYAEGSGSPAGRRS